MKKLFFSIVMCLMALTVYAQRIAVLEFESAKGISVADVDGISRMFMTYFHPAGYTLVDRNQVNKIISEQGFQRSSLTQEQMVRLGELLNVSKVVVGTVSMLGGKYQVDVSVDDVELGDYIATEGATFTGDYRTHVRDLATKLAAKIAVRSAGTVYAQPTAAKKRSTVEVLYGYLKIFPNELGAFDSEPTSVISQINKQAQYGYNNWRIPTNEELSLMKANNYLGSGDYMTRESRRGKVLLVTDGDDIQTLKAKEQEQKRLAAEQERKRLAAEQERLGIYTVNGVSFKMIRVEGGTFQMGSTTGDDDEKPVHQVTLSNFSIGQTEVTQELWQAVMGSNPSNFSGSKRPVEKVSWNDCRTFITKLNQLTGKTFRLPTEAEWEYAARGGNKSKGYVYSGSNEIDDVAWYTSNSSSTTHDVATKSPNELGIYDMSGNVWEWCQDWYGSYSSSSQTNPTGPTSSVSNRVERGGSWYSSATYCRVAVRYYSAPTSTYSNLGFRLAQ